METTIFNEREFYESEIIPIVEALQKACKAKGLPYVCSVVYQQDGMKSGRGVFMENNARHGMGVLLLSLAGVLCTADITKTATLSLLLMVAKLLNE